MIYLRLGVAKSSYKLHPATGKKAAWLKCVLKEKYLFLHVLLPKLSLIRLSGEGIDRPIGLMQGCEIYSISVVKPANLEEPG
jgi:hypothetical protein